MRRSRTRQSHSNATSAEVCEALYATRQAHPSWGPRKLLDFLRRKGPALALPAPSTAGDILKRAGLVKPRQRSRAPVRSITVHAPPAEPNGVWAIDFKGWFRTGDHSRCNPLTVTDLFSRYLLVCKHMDRGTQEHVQQQLIRAFREYGMPWALRSDNGSPFGSRGLAGFSSLNVWLLRLGIRIEHIEPGKPQQNGVHERMHRTLKEDTAKPPRATLRDQQRAFDRFRRDYNYERPHESLAGASPGSFYTPSGRQFPERLPEVVYPDHYAVRRVRNTGQIKWKSGRIFLGEAFIGQTIGLQQKTDRHWLIHFTTVPIGVLDESLMRVTGKFDWLLNPEQPT